jgi:ATPase subunit of ABC transporter with duplicated ATPase domains
MLQVSHLGKAFGVQTVLDDISFILNRGDRAGLIGVNGAGKTTLLRILAGLETPDSGLVALDAHATIGYLAQGQRLEVATTLDLWLREGISGWTEAQREMDAQAQELARAGSSPVVMTAYSDAVARFEALGGYEIETRIAQVISGLGLRDVPGSLPLDRLSGGQRTRAGLARLLIAAPGLLLLDEPTNHLDVEALEWLEEFIGGYAGAVLLVSHDRIFLDHTVSQILELDDTSHRLTVYHGNYTEYETAKAKELGQQWAIYQDQQAELARLTEAARHLRGLAKFRKGGKADTNDKFAKGFFANRGKETVRRAKAVERRIELLQTENKIDKPRAGYALKLDLNGRGLAEMPRSGQMVLTAQDLGHSFQDGARWLFRHGNLTLQHGERIALVGANGAGKTTLLRILVGEIEPTEGTVKLGANVQRGYMPQEQETLDPRQTPLSLIRSLLPVDETEARHWLHYFMFERDEVLTPIGQLSYGERARLILARLIAERANVLILDEPINHLDIPSRERFEAALDRFPGTVLVAVHDRAFIDRFATGIWLVEQETVRAYPDRAAMLRRNHQQ